MAQRLTVIPWMGFEKTHGVGGRCARLCAIIYIGDLPGVWTSSHPGQSKMDDQYLSVRCVNTPIQQLSVPKTSNTFYHIDLHTQLDYADL